MSKLFLAGISIALTTLCAHAQSGADTKSGDLFRTIAALDTSLFNAYNRCELEKFGSLLAPDLEFYHDQSGLETGRQNVVNSVRKYICGKVRRELVVGTLEVHPLKGYGAVEIGVHRFTHPGADDREPAGEAKFIHVWRLKQGKWQLARVISFDHQTAAR